MRNLGRACWASLFVGLVVCGLTRAEVPTLEVRFPQVKGWSHTDRRPLPEESNGYSVAYDTSEGPKVAVTIYVYNRSLPRVADNLSDKNVQREFEGAKEAIQEAKRLGLYQTVIPDPAVDSTLGGLKTTPKALHARFRLNMRGTDTLSDIYVLPYQNQFIKVRVSRAAEDAAAAREPLERLYSQLGALFGK